MNSPTISGKLDVELKIDAKGKVKSAKAADGSTLDDKNLQECVLSALRSTSFPPADSGKGSTLTVPIVLGK